MSKIFISHSSTNNPEALAISQWLDENGWSDYFLDITPTRGLSPGERWQEALKAAANRCEAVLFLISQPWLDSKWCLAEFLLAKSLGKNIFGVLIEDLDLDSLPVEMTGEYQLCDLVHGDERSSFEVQHDPLVPQTKVEFSKSGLDLLCIGLKNSGLDANSFPWPPKDDPDRAPYRGLKTLEEKDAAIYFGRDAEIVRGLDELRKLRELGLNKMLVILGSSGSGKSSFLGAGLMARLKRDDRHFLTLPIIRPGRDALNGDRGLVACLEQAFAQFEIKKTRAQIRAFLEQSDGLKNLLLELRDASMKTQGKDPIRPTILISIDQCEELYSSDIQAAQMLRAYLGSALLSKSTQSRDTQAKLHIITLVTIRADLYEQLQTDSSFSGVQQHLYNLTPLDPTEYKEIIEGPAEQATKAGNTLEIEPALTARLLADAKGADALPLLAFTLEHLFVEHGSDGDLTLDEYKSVGGIQGAVELAVSTALSEPGANPVIPSDDSDQKKLLRSAFIPWLVEIDDSNGEYKRRITKWDEMPTETHSLVERLITAGLLTRDKRKTAKDRHEEIIVEVAHEALLRRWPTLVRWIEEDSDALRITGAVVKCATDWKNNQCGDEYLDHKGERLLETEKVQNRKDLKQRLGETGRAYIKQCRQHEQDQIKKEKQQLEKITEEQTKTRKYQKRVSYVLLCVSLLMTGIGYWIYQQALETTEQVSKMFVNESQHAAKANRNQRALKLALLATQENWRTNATTTATVNLAGIAQSFPLEAVLTGHSEAVLHASFNPGGTRIVTASRDNTARIWDAATGEPVGQPLQHQSGVNHASFNPAGTRILTASWDKTARIWDATTGEPVGQPLQHKGAVNHASFNPAGTRIVTASYDNSARIWDAATGDPVGQPFQHQHSVNHASFNPDGSRIVTASYDQTARIWNATTGEPVGQPLQHQHSVNHASFNSDGSRIVTTCGDNTARIWNATTGEPVGQPLQHEGQVFHASFNPVGTRIVTASWDYTARIWDSTTGEPMGQPLQHDVLVTHASFNPSGTWVLTVSRDDAVRIWDASTGEPVGQPLRHDARVEYAGFDPSGTRIVTTSWDNIARVWDVNFDQPAGDQFLGADLVRNVNANQDGTRIVIVYKDGTARIWDTITGQAVGVPLPPSGIGYARFNPDGSRVVTQGNKTIRIWDANTGQPLGVPIQHKDGFSFNPAMTRIVTISKDGIGQIWDTDTSEPVGVPLIHDGGIYRVWFNPTGSRIVTGSVAGRSVMIWDADTGKQVGDALQHEVFAKQISFNPVGTQMVTIISLDKARIWDTSNGEPVGDPLHHGRNVESASYNKDGTQIVTVGYDNTARIWDASTAKQVGDILKHEATIYHADFSSDGTLIVTVSGDKTARIWDARTGQPVTVLEHQRDVKYASFNPAGTHIVTSDNFYIRIWEVETGLSVGNPMLREVPGTQVSFIPTGTHIVATGLGFTRTWDVTWLTQYPEREDLLQAVCRKWGADVMTLTEFDINEPLISADRVGEDTCPSHD